MSMNTFYSYAFDKADVRKVLDHYGMDYTPREDELWMCCPFHNEVEPSFSINVKKKFFRCWGCNEKGNVFQFIQKIETLNSATEVSYRDAVLKCCKICHIHVSDADLLQYQSDEDDDISDILEFASDAQETVEQKTFVESALDKFKRYHHSYFLKRGFKQETLDYLEMGFLTGDPRNVMNNRCVFPIRNATGQLIGWTGRTVLKGVEPKWLHAPKNEFRKAYALYNIDKALPYVLESGEINVVESVANAARMIEAGKLNTVATLGAGLSEFQYAMLEQYARKIVFWFDWDSGGFKGIELAFEYAHDSERIFVAVTDYGVDADGWPLDLGDVDTDAVTQTQIITSYEYKCLMERRFVSTMSQSVDKDTKLSLPDGSTVIYTNKLKRDSDLPQLIPEDVIFLQTIDNLMGIKRMTVYNSK